MPIRNRSKVESNTMAGNVETSVSPVEATPEDDSETEGYINTDTDTENKQPVTGTLVMKTVGIVKCKKKRKARCKICKIFLNNMRTICKRLNG